MSPSHTDPAVEQCSSAAEIFATQKLKLLRAKLTPLTETDASSDSDAVVRAPVQTDTSSQCSKIAERAFTEACLGRLNTSVAECPARVNQSSTVVGTTRPFAAQYERLKMESLQHTMEKQIKVV